MWNGNIGVDYTLSLRANRECRVGIEYIVSPFKESSSASVNNFSVPAPNWESVSHLFVVFEFVSVF